MLRRALATLAAASALLLAGCSGGGAADPAAQSQASSAIANVSVIGEPWTEPTVTIGDISGLGGEVERETVSGGGGRTITASDRVIASAVIYDAATKQPQGPYQPLGQVLDLADPQLEGVFRDLFTGVASGSRIAALIPGQVLAGGTAQPGATPPSPALIVADVEALEHTAAWGAEQAPAQQLATLGPDGADGSPGPLSIDAAQPAPAALVVDVAKLGDGPMVAEGDTVTLQYRGVLFPSGEEFDSSWTRGAPAQFRTDQVVPGFSQALIGRSVGSRVIAIIPPELGYGATGSGQTIPPNATLIFVIDILAAH